MNNFGQFTYPEISSQSDALQAAWEQLKKQEDWVRDHLANSEFDEVIFIGSGSSYYQALSMASTYRSWMSRAASAYPSSELYLFREQTAPAGRRYLVVGVSRSGESTEVVLALESVKDVPGFTIAGVTCYESSAMARLAPCLVSPLGKERSTVMTKSFSSMTFLMQAAIAKAAGRQDRLEELAALLALDAEAVKKGDAFAQKVVQSGEFKKYIYLGMGTYYGIALESCLKVKEMSYVWTEAYGTLEFRHGPKSIVEPGTLVCVLLSEQARAYELKVAEEMKDFGAYVAVLAARPGADLDFADAVLPLGGEALSDDARAVLYLPALQYLGYYTALRRGVDPDSPRNLTQVVKI